MTGRLTRPAVGLLLVLAVAACGQGQSNPAGPASSGGPSGVPSGHVTRAPSANPKGFSGTITAAEEWNNPAFGYAGPDWSKQHLTVNVSLKPRAGSDGVTGWFDDFSSTYQYDGSAHYQETDPLCPRNDDRTSTGSGSFGGGDREISLFVDPANGTLLLVSVAFTMTEKNASCDVTTTGSIDDLWQPSCGGDVADAAGHGRLLGIPKASDGSIDFTCSGPTIHSGVGSGTITVSGTLTRT